MSRKILALLTAFLFIFTQPAFATPVNPLSIFKTIPADQDVAGILVSDSAVYLFGNTPAGGYVTALNKDGSQKWQHTFADQSAFTITAGALDASGNIWLAGASAAPIAMNSAPNPTPTAANPDGVVIGSEEEIRPDLTNLTLWKVSNLGDGAGKYQLPLTKPVLPTSLSINKSGISIVAWQSAGSLFVSADLTGGFSKVLNVGKSTTTLDKVIRNNDGTSILLGSSTELLLAAKAIGVRDGLVIKVDATPKIVQIGRSGEKGSSRNWASATSSLLLGGYLKSSTSTLATVTKFGSNLKPTWTFRYKATSSAVVTNGTATSYFVAYENKGTGTLLNLDKNGKTTSNISFLGQPISLNFNKSLGLYIYNGTTIYNLLVK